MVALEVGPEHAQTAPELLQAAVVDRWLAFPQVVDEQVTDGPAGEPGPGGPSLWAGPHIPPGRPPPAGPRRPHPRRRAGAEAPRLSQQPVAGGCPAPGRAV